MGITLGSHDDNSAEGRAAWRARGARISEFPETLEAAEAARAGGDFIILGSPNVVRGGSHKGNASAIELIAMGLCDALASDYHYPSPRRAALMLAKSGLLPLEQAWALPVVMVAWGLLHAGTMWLNAARDQDAGEVLFGSGEAPEPPATLWGYGALVLGAASAALMRPSSSVMWASVGLEIHTLIQSTLM